jgi:hypothetical protein
MKSHAQLSITSAGTEIKVQCTINQIDGGGKAYPHTSLKVDRTALAHRIGKIKDVLSEDMTNIWASLPDPLANPKDTNNPSYVAKSFKKCMDSTLNEGSTLFFELSENGLEEIMYGLDKMEDGSTITIDTDCAFLPFEILTAKSFSNNPNLPPIENPSKPQDMWGYRFIIDYNVKTNSPDEVAALSAAHLGSKPFVGVNLNPTIDNAFKDKAFKPLKFHQTFYQKEITNVYGEVDLDPASIFGKLISNQYQATLIYLYCHGSNSNPFGINNDELLQFDENFKFPPAELSKRPSEYPHAPIVFLNSCLSGLPSPLSFTSFQAEFRKKKALGFIGTAIQMPATFAAAFGCRLIKDYLKGAQLGAAIWKLRCELIENGNPLGLFYVLQCPAEVRVATS